MSRPIIATVINQKVKLDKAGGKDEWGFAKLKVRIYAPWCMYSKELAEELIEHESVHWHYMKEINECNSDGNEKRKAAVVRCVTWAQKDLETVFDAN